MAIYGDLGLNVQTNIIIDKIYTSKAELEEANNNKDDGIFVGRFVQINDGSASSTNDNLTVWRKVGYGEYELFANYNVKLPTITLAAQASQMGTDPTLTFNTPEQYILTLPQMSSLIEDIDFSYSDGDTNSAELIRLGSSTSNIINYQLKLQIDAIGKTIANFNKYFQDPPSGNNGLAVAAYEKFIEQYDELVDDYNKYFHEDNGLTIIAYNNFIAQYNRLVNDYNNYFGENGLVITDYLKYFDDESGLAVIKYQDLVDKYLEYFNENSGKIPTDYNKYFNRDSGLIGSFDKWVDEKIPGTDVAIYTEDDKKYLLFPYQDPDDDNKWKASKIDLNSALQIINSTINIEDGGKTLAIVQGGAN